MAINEDENGLSMSPAPTQLHEAIIQELYYKIRLVINNNYRPFIPVRLDPLDPNSEQPDFSVWKINKQSKVKYDYDTIVFLIEVTTVSKFKSIVTKCKGMLKKSPSIEEIFIYNYETKQWYELENNEIIENDHSGSFGSLTTLLEDL